MDLMKASVDVSCAQVIKASVLDLSKLVAGSANQLENLQQV